MLAARHERRIAHPASGSHVDAEQARAALEHAARTVVVAPHDRAVYAIGTALFGVGLGIFAPLSRTIDGGRPGPLGAFFIAFLLGVAVWQTRAARSIPRGAKRIGYLGTAGMVVVSLAFTIALNWRELSTPTPLWLLVVNGLAVALPMARAGLVIWRSRR